MAFRQVRKATLYESAWLEGSIVKAEIAVFALYCERLAKIIVLISAKIQGNFIDYYMNICYTVFSTFKEV